MASTLPRTSKRDGWEKGLGVIRAVFSAGWWFACVGLLGSPLSAQVAINEVIAENGDEGPADSEGGTPDLIELINLTGEDVVLGAPLPKDSYYLSDTESRSMSGELVFKAEEAWKFPPGVELAPNGRLVVFCDGDQTQTCEVHTSFQIDSNGSEPILLWSPEDDEGMRSLVDRLYLPPLRRNVSFGRFPDGSGPTPLPLEMTLEFCVYNPPGTSTFGRCRVTENSVSCGDMKVTKSCTGDENGPGGNLEPRISRSSASTNAPRAGEAVVVTAEVTDDKEPIPSNIVRAEIHYRVDGELQPPVAMEFVESLDGTDRVPPRPLSRWGVFVGEIPGQPANTHVAFQLFVEDAEGLVSTSPRTQCAAGVGPCNAIGLPGPGCTVDPDDPLRFAECDVWDEYVSGYEPSGALEFLVVNEIVSSQSRILIDPTELNDQCGGMEPTTSCRFDDFIEVYNGSTEAIPLDNIWLSDGRFNPRGWKFPAGAEIGSEEYLIVWVDGDGGKCPRPDNKILGDGQDCPDPTNVELGRYHASFSLNADGDQIYIFEESETGSFGLVHGYEYDLQTRDTTFALSPNGCRYGDFVIRTPTTATPGAHNELAGECVKPQVDPLFKRGDINDDCQSNVADAIFGLSHLFGNGAAPVCPDALDVNDSGGVDISDPIFLLNYLFSTGAAPPAPGPDLAGVDPTPDDLALCGARDCP